MTTTDHLRTIRGSKTDAYRYAYHAAQGGRTLAATLAPFVDPQGQHLARNGWEDGVADQARYPEHDEGPTSPEDADDAAAHRERFDCD